jgi:hypothetical protein
MARPKNPHTELARLQREANSAIRRAYALGYQVGNRSAKDQIISLFHLPNPGKKKGVRRGKRRG